MRNKLMKFLRNSVLSLSLLGLGCSSLDEKVRNDEEYRSTQSSVSSSSDESKSSKTETEMPSGVFGGFEMYDVMQRGELNTHMSDHAFGMGFVFGAYLNDDMIRVGPEFHSGFSFYPANDIIETELLLGVRGGLGKKVARPYMSAGGMLMFHNRWGHHALRSSDDDGGGGGCSYGCYKSTASNYRRRLNSAGVRQDSAGEQALGFYSEIGIDFVAVDKTGKTAVSFTPFVRYTRAEIGDSHSRDEYGSDEIMWGLRIGGQ